MRHRRTLLRSCSGLDALTGALPRTFLAQRWLCLNTESARSNRLQMETPRAGFTDNASTRRAVIAPVVALRGFRGAAAGRPRADPNVILTELNA